MIEKNIAQWIISFIKKDDLLTITVKNSDKSKISDTGSDIGSDGEFGYRLTSEKIEDLYKSNGDANAKNEVDNISIGNWRVEIINDEDNHLNLYCFHTTSDSLKEISTKDDSCEYEIILTDSDFLHE